ncbi:MAG: DUF2282 domain-containing protein [Rickettsiales bacterium]|nr:MAG: DUF2282 domain-containing protein [Rickettsiales bacterium]
MKKSGIFTAVAAAVTLTAGVAFAESDMEKCKVVKDGKGLIKEHKADCKGASHSCAGQNKAGDAESWIMVPKGQCDKINAGDVSEVEQDIIDKIEITK